jgi:two-component system response regulator AtoC
MEDKLIFLIDDEENFTKLVSHWVSEKWGYQIKVFRDADSFFSFNDAEPDVILLDIMLPGINGIEILKKTREKKPDLPIVMLSAQGNIDTAIETLKLGAFDYLSKPLDLPKLQVTIKNAIKNYDLARELKNLLEEKQQTYSFDNIIAIDNKMEEVFRLMRKVLNTSVNVIIYGESGTGKELIARAIHFNSERKTNPFVVVNCASIPRDLLESELFGHEKGSFTGAHIRKIGKFELADGGTIFLDEIGELELSLQSKLLRVLQDKTFERVGGTELIKTDARVISATNRDLKKAVDDKLFREDLYYRLSAYPITVPPLRTRRGDVLLLADSFTKKFSEDAKIPMPTLSKQVVQIFLEYPWPGNVRELENSLQRAVIVAEQNQIQVKDLPLAMQGFASEQLLSNVTSVDDEQEQDILPFEVIKEQAIRNSLKATNGNIVEAAKKLKLGRATIYRLISKYKIDTSAL